MYGCLCKAWFDVEELPPTNESGSDSISRQIQHVIRSLEQIISAELRRGRSRVVVAGFGQGAAVALMLSLTSLSELAGVASLSGWIPHDMRAVCIQHTIPSNHLLINNAGYGAYATLPACVPRTW